MDGTPLYQGDYQLSKINLRPFLRCFKTDFSGISDNSTGMHDE